MNKKVIIINVLLTLILLVICDLCIGLLYNTLAPAYGKKNIDILLGTIGTEKLLRERLNCTLTCCGKTLPSGFLATALSKPISKDTEIRMT